MHGAAVPRHRGLCKKILAEQQAETITYSDRS